MLRVAIIGLGTISYIHQLGIEESKTGELVAVCDTNPTTKSDFPNLPFYERCSNFPSSLMRLFNSSKYKSSSKSVSETSFPNQSDK